VDRPGLKITAAAPPGKRVALDQLRKASAVYLDLFRAPV
jgi:hypothetical protein